MTDDDDDLGRKIKGDDIDEGWDGMNHTTRLVANIFTLIHFVSLGYMNN